MDILLWRHAEAEEGLPDLKRKLTQRGQKQAQQIAEWIKKHGPENLRILSSPARRCQQTTEALALPFETDKRLGTDSDVSSLLAAIGWPGVGKEGAVLIVGHQPTLGQIAALLLSGEEANWAIKKGAVWWFSHSARQGASQTVLRAVIPPDFAHHA